MIASHRFLNIASFADVFEVSLISIFLYVFLFSLISFVEDSASKRAANVCNFLATWIAF